MNSRAIHDCTAWNSESDAKKLRKIELEVWEDNGIQAIKKRTCKFVTGSVLIIWNSRLMKEYKLNKASNMIFKHHV